MVIGFTLFIVIILIVGIWLIIEAKRMKHKVFAIFLIILILFTYISFSAVIKDEGIQLNSVSGIMSAGKLYLSWLVGAFKNVKSVTSYAAKQNWTDTNKTTNVSVNSNESVWDKL